MTHPGSGNPTWQDWPSTQTPVTAFTLESLENAVDAQIAGQWVSLPLQNDWVPRDSAAYYKPACRLATPDTVELTGALYRATGAGNGEGIALLPQGFRPARETIIPIVDSGGYAPTLIVRVTGYLVVATYRTTSNALYLSGRFPLTALP